VLKYGGALSGEHGDGLVRSPFQEKMFGGLYEAFAKSRRPSILGILNPGKIVDALPLSSNLRYGPGYVTPECRRPSTSADGGIVSCGRAVCRRRRVPQKTRRHMCPSYQATCEEQHSTRAGPML